jgi:hypothetical protein
MAKPQEARGPVYQAYTVVKREGADDFWINVGAAFEHADGKGLNVILQALPIDGKIVLRPPKDRGERPDETERAQATVRDINDSRRGR